MTSAEEQQNKLVKDLKYYENLEAIGNVYSISKHDSSHTSNELLYQYFLEMRADGSTDMTDDEFNEIMNFSPEHLDSGLFKSESKCNCQKMYLRYSSYLAKNYYKIYGKVAPRFKQQITKGDVVRGKSGFKNFYPPHFISQTREFLEKYPLDMWGKSINKPVYSTEIIIKTDHTHSKCVSCDKIILNKSVKQHLLSKTHLASS